MGSAVIEPELARSLMLEWASILFYTARESLDAAYVSCGIPCFVAKVQQMQLSCQLVDYIYGLPAGTVCDAARSLGFVLRGM